MRVLAVDPGLTRCGVAVVEQVIGGRLRALDVTVLRTGPDEPLEQRLETVHGGVSDWLDRYGPDVVAVERVFSQTNVISAMHTAQAAAVAMLAAQQHGAPVHQHTPTEVKAAVTGSGSADKQQVAFMVTRILGLREAPKPVDATDALALAICHMWRSRRSVRVSR